MKPILRDLSANLMHLAWDCAYRKLRPEETRRQLSDAERKARRRRRKLAKAARRAHG
jgi:hypothetical protein